MKAKRWIILPIVITGVLIVCLICIGLFPTTKQNDNTGVRQEEAQKENQDKDDKTELGATPVLPADSSTDESGNDAQVQPDQGSADPQKPDTKKDNTKTEEKEPEQGTESTPETTPDNNQGDSVEMPYVPFD